MKYSKFIQEIIQKHAELHRSVQVPVETIFDIERHHYLLLEVGWHNGDWAYNSILHLDIIDGKIYIQQNNTEMEIASKLVEMGVPKHDIVLGFQSPFKRQLTEYAVS